MVIKEYETETSTLKSLVKRMENDLTQIEDLKNENFELISELRNLETEVKMSVIGSPEYQQLKLEFDRASKSLEEIQEIQHQSSLAYTDDKNKFLQKIEQMDAENSVIAHELQESNCKLVNLMNHQVNLEEQLVIKDKRIQEEHARNVAFEQTVQEISNKNKELSRLLDQMVYDQSKMIECQARSSSNQMPPKNRLSTTINNRNSNLQNTRISQQVLSCDLAPLQYQHHEVHIPKHEQRTSSQRFIEAPKSAKKSLDGFLTKDSVKDAIRSRSNSRGRDQCAKKEIDEEKLRKFGKSAKKLLDIFGSGEQVNADQGIEQAARKSVDDEIDINMSKVRERKRQLEEKIRQFESKMGSFGI